jgi:hypothetical protein
MFMDGNAINGAVFLFDTLYTQAFKTILPKSFRISTRPRALLLRKLTTGVQRPPLKALMLMA